MATETTTTTTTETGTETANANAATGYVESPELTAAKARAAAMYSTPTVTPAPATSSSSASTFDYEIHGELTRVGQARATFERERAALYRSDGAPRYGEAEHGEQMAAITARLDDTLGGAQEAAERITAEQRTQLAHLEGGDTLDALNSIEQMAADTRRAFIAEDAATLTPAALATRCQIALAGSDKATQYLLARYVGRRVAVAVEVARAVPPTASAPTGNPAWLTMEQREELASLVNHLSGKVRGVGGVTKAEAARARLAKAQELRATTVALYDQAHEYQKRLEQDLRASGRYSI